MANEEKTNELPSSLQQKKKSGFLKKILGKAVIFFLIGALIIAALYYYNSEVTQTNKALPGDVNLTGAFNRSKNGNFVDNPYFSKPLSFTINLKDRRRFLKVTFYLGLNDARAISYIERRMPIINDIIISTIQYKTADDLQDVLGIERLKAELLTKLNNEVFSSTFSTSIDSENKKIIRRILLTEFILQ